MCIYTHVTYILYQRRTEMRLGLCPSRRVYGTTSGEEYMRYSVYSVYSSIV